MRPDRQDDPQLDAAGELVAESAYSVCASSGIEPGEFSITYLVGWSERTPIATIERTAETGAYGTVLNVRLAAKGLNTREVVLDPCRRAETRRLAFEPETDEDPEVSLDQFTREGVDRGRAGALLSVVQHWDLECRQRTPDVPAIEQLLAERYGY